MWRHTKVKTGGDILEEDSERQRYTHGGAQKERHSGSKKRRDTGVGETHTWRRQQYTVKSRKGRKYTKQKGTGMYIYTEKHSNLKRQKIPGVEDWGIGR